MIGGNQSWKQTFTFDRYGNRRFDFSNGNTTFPDPNCSEPICNPTISTSNNRLTSTGWSYDSAGNTTRDGSYSTFTYDAENKQVLVRNSSNVTRGEYWYDGDGKRVKKKAYDSSGNLTEDTIFVYDATGRSIAEYSAIDPNQSEGGSAPAVAYLTNDHLGSPRINTNASGAVTSRHDYHPFGEEIISAQRTNHADYSGDPVRKQFTGYERDAETQLDFAEMRMYTSRAGRFSAPDSLGGTIIEPQTLNKYTYVTNNPLNIIDPSGLCGTTAGSDDGSPCIWLTKDGKYQSVSQNQYNNGGFDEWKVVNRVDVQPFALTALEGTYAGDAEYQSFVNDGTLVELGENGRFVRAPQGEVRILDDENNLQEGGRQEPSFAGLNPLYEPLPWRNPLTTPRPDFFGARQPVPPKGIPTLPNPPGPLTPGKPIISVPSQPGVPGMNPNTPNIGPDAPFRVRAALVLTQLIRVLTNGGQVVPPQNIAPIIVCRPCIMVDEMKRKMEEDRLHS